MHIILATLWTVLAVAWLSGIRSIARAIGGYQWIDHMGKTCPVAMLVLVALLCVAAAVSVALMRRIPISLSIAIAAVVGLHVFNALGTVIVLNMSGRIPPEFLLPFFLVSNALPTTTAFLGAPYGIESLFILPIATALLWTMSLGLNPRGAIRETP
jgi:hypothetical protein